MTKKTQLLFWVTVLGILDAVIPFFPILAFVLVYVLLDRPPWFLNCVEEIYGSN
jgi:hypothetical protein